MACYSSAVDALAHCSYLNTNYPSFILRLDNGTYADTIERATAIVRMILRLKRAGQMLEAREVYVYASQTEVLSPLTVKFSSVLESLTHEAQSALNIEYKKRVKKEEVSPPSDAASSTAVSNE